jgi:hypothetical protein
MEDRTIQTFSPMSFVVFNDEKKLMLLDVKNACSEFDEKT